MASVVGRQSQDAQSQLAVQQQTVAQARNLRSQASGVDLNAEAVKMVEFQRAYSATSKMVSILDELTQTTINMLPTP